MCLQLDRHGGDRCRRWSRTRAQARPRPLPVLRQEAARRRSATAAAAGGRSGGGGGVRGVGMGEGALRGSRGGAPLYRHGVRRHHLPEHPAEVDRPHHHPAGRRPRPRRHVLPLGHPRRGAGLLRHVRARLRRAPLSSHFQKGCCFGSFCIF